MTTLEESLLAVIVVLVTIVLRLAWTISRSHRIKD